ncbi:MAG: hypothetical protein HYU52_09550 [Acidobacteria bacterium]|nr:hypothetical protein [Acidobacteriota bacterium]
MNRIAIVTSLLILTANLSAEPHASQQALASEGSRATARASMEQFVKGQMANGTYYFYDAVEQRLLALRFRDIHGDVRVDEKFHVSCSYFRDQFGRTIDIDFLALPKGQGFATVQGVIHSIDGKERPYRLTLEKATK